jgi:hypothetical protein
MHLDIRNHGLKRRRLLLIRSKDARFVRAAFVTHRRKGLLRILKITAYAHPNELRRNLKISGHARIGM